MLQRVGGAVVSKGSSSSSPHAKYSMTSDPLEEELPSRLGSPSVGRRECTVLLMKLPLAVVSWNDYDRHRKDIDQLKQRGMASH